MSNNDEELTLLPNIGSALAEKLRRVDVKTPNDLRQLGAEACFLRLLTIDKDACSNMLYALEGAVQGIRWHDLDKYRKQELKEFFVLAQKGII